MTIRASRFGSSRPRVSPLPKRRSDGREHHRSGHEQRRAEGGREREGDPLATDASDVGARFRHGPRAYRQPRGTHTPMAD